MKKFATQRTTLRTTRSSSRFSMARTGTTLVEVMVSLLITAIGIASVASIFPVSVLRAVRATRLNKSVLVRLNMEELIDIDSRIVHDPDGNGIFADHNNKNYVVDPLGHMIMETGVNTDLPGTLGGNDPNALNRWGLGQILDPNTDKTIMTAGSTANVTFRAADFVTLSDTWVTQSESIVNITAANSINVANTEISGNLTEISFADPFAMQSMTAMPSRVIVSTPDGSQSVARIVTDITGTTLTLANPLPAGFVGSQSRVIVETKEFRFSTMLTVRKALGNGTIPPDLNMATIPQFGALITDADSTTSYSNNGSFRPTSEIGPAEVDVVVFVNRRFNRADETIFDLTPEPGNHAEEAVRRFKVDFAGNPRPAMKRGGFMLDPFNARWYRIEKIEDETSSDAIILLDTGPPPGEAITKGIFMKGVIEVFPIGIK